ncbi:MAG: class I SAM-dependent methyltransferase [Cyanobacteriota bacterium]|nr:class I SAM-dependent methyltransferase [Cyanobacteriota bacterium]
MTATTTSPGLASRLVNGILAIKPLANLAKNRARKMMIERAEQMGVPWRDRVRELSHYDWDSRFQHVQNPNVTYPDYYLRSFHAYDAGNLNWEAAWEEEVAAYAVHSRLWPDAGKQGDARLRQCYHDALRSQIPVPPQKIVDLGCGVGMSAFALQNIYPEAQITGVDLSPYFLAVAQYNSEQRDVAIAWQHAAAEATGLPDASFDLVSACLLFHELPQAVSKAAFTEAKRLLRPGGSFAMMDMNPRSEAYATMPPYILTLLKSTEPYLDEYFTLDIEQSLMEAGFERPTIAPKTPRHRAVVAKVRSEL